MKKSISGFALSLASTAVSLVVLEALLRLFIPVDMGTTWEYRVPHPKYGWVLQSGAHYHYRLPGDVVSVAYNSRGFRDSEHSYAGREDTRRIVLLGDSFMEAYSVELGEAFHKQLEGRLGSRDRPFEVINLGVGGYGTLQQYLMFMNEGRRYEPDFVLLGFYPGNDLRNNSLELESLVNADHMKVLGRPFLDIGEPDSFTVTQVDYDAAVRRYRAAQAEMQTFWKRLTQMSVIAKLVDTFAERYIATENSRNAVMDKDRDFVMLGMHQCEEAEAFRRAWDITGRLIERLNAEVQRSGAELLLFSVPALHEVDDATAASVTAGYSAPEALCLKQAPAYVRLRELVRSLGIGYIDLLPAFRRASADNTDLFRADRHWNAAGHALAARLVAEVID